jgi:hypothetical protein
VGKVPEQYGLLNGRKTAVKSYEAELAIKDGQQRLLVSLTGRSGNLPEERARTSRVFGGKKTARFDEGKYRQETFDVPCSSLWNAIKDAIGRSKNYQMIDYWDADFMAVFSIGNEKSLLRIDYLTLQGSGNRCTEHFVNDFARVGLKLSDDANALNKLVRSTL